MKTEKIVAFKGMDPDMCCKGKQYEEGKTYTEDLARCFSHGMHACTYPIDTFRFYKPDGKNRFFQVECGGDVNADHVVSNLACTEMTVHRELKLPLLIKAALHALKERVSDDTPETASGKRCIAAARFDYTAAAASGDSSAAYTEGEHCTAAASGYGCRAAAGGDYYAEHCAAAASGGWCSAVVDGVRSTAATSGGYSLAVTGGESSAAAATGIRSTAITIGLCSTAATTGAESTAVASGDYSAAVAIGADSVAIAAGEQCTAVARSACSSAKATGTEGIAIATGYAGKAQGELGCYLVLAEYDNNRTLSSVATAKVDGERIKPNVWYTLKNGEFVEAEKK